MSRELRSYSTPQATPGTVGNAGILYINVEGAREPFADMYNWAELKWWWRNPYTQHMLLQYFEPTGLVTQLPDAYNYKPYWYVPCSPGRPSLAALCT